MRIDIAGIGREPDRVTHAEFLASMRQIDQLGFDGIWFNEFHFQTPPQPYPSPLLLAASIFGCVFNGNGVLARQHTSDQLLLFARTVLPSLRQI